MAEILPLCNAADLVAGGLAVSFEVRYQGQSCRAFAVRFEGKAHAYLNRCAHLPMELDFQPDQFFDNSGRWLVCATHGAIYEPDTGRCRGGPCRGALVKIELVEYDGVVHWHTAHDLIPLEF